MTEINFSRKLLYWHKKNQRDFPWKQTNDPYKIWLSEIILQQTRVDQGLPYYKKFVSTFPTVQNLAKAHEDDVLKLWQGLGYYSRARNLHAAAKYMVHELNGELPKSYNEWIKLKGIGPYSAAAISSFAFNEPRAVVDGNVVRLLARIFGIRLDPSSTVGKKKFQKLATSLLSKKYPGKYNQAIMDYGSTVCKPQNPNCHTCIYKLTCYAYSNDQIQQLPVKKKKNLKKKRYLNFLFFQIGQSTFIEKRKKDDVWKGLFQFPCIESKKPLFDEEVLNQITDWKAKGAHLISTVNKQHILSHQLLHCTFFHIEIKNIKPMPVWKKINCQNLRKFAVPRVIDWYFKEQKLVND